MASRFKGALTSRAVLLTGGLVAVFLVSFLLWVQLSAPLTVRLPVPSPDGKYFVYFDRIRGSTYDLIVSTARGHPMARFPMEPGPIFWSNAGHLAVVGEGRNRATLIANAEGRFLILTRLALSRGTEPRWSSDGTKLAYFRPTAGGDQLAIYDILQTQAFVVPVSPEFHLRQPTLLFWSPGSEQLFFLNLEAQDVVLEKVDVQSGYIQALAKGTEDWKVPGSSLPRMSRDGARIYLGRPLHSVIDARTGETLWAVPREAKVLWSPWSADGRQLFYSLQGASAQIYAHDFARQTDQVILSHVQPNGFFTVDGRSYFFRTSQGRRPDDYWPGLREWLKKRWGWQHVDVLTQSAQPLGRVELWPWEQTQDGWILARHDNYHRVSFGLYDPNGRVLSQYVFPTVREDLFRQVKSQSIVLLAVALYAGLAFVVYLKLPGSAPVRALCILSLLSMPLIARGGVMHSASSFQPHFPFAVTAAGTGGLGWWTPNSFSWFIFDEFIPVVFLSLVALLLPSLLNFVIVFPEGNEFLGRRKALEPLLYGAAFLPLLGMIVALTFHGDREGLRLIVLGLILMAGSVVAITALLSLLYNYLHPPNRRAKDQVRWVAMAFALPGVVLGALVLIEALVSVLSRLAGRGSQDFLDVFSPTTPALLCLFTPLAIGYALVAHKLFDLQLLIRRTARYVLMTFLVVVVYLLVLGGLRWGIAGSLQSPFQAVIMISLLLTALIIAPARSRLQSFIDRTVDRARYEFREALQNFARDLPNILDRPTLAWRLSMAVQRAMGSRRFWLFVLDRQTKKLRPQLSKGELRAKVADVQFDPGEPLCRYLLEEGRPFEVEISPYSPKLIPIIRSSADRLGRLEAAVVLGLERREELVGLMVLGTKASEEFYNTEDLELLVTVARQAAVAIANTELFEEVAQDRELQRELEVASEVQAHLFPTVVPRLAGCQVAGRCLPAHSVSGDYYDFLELPGQKVGLAIGDVSGKGMSASLLMANLQGLLRTQAPAAESLVELVRRINRQICGSSPGAKYCTFFYAVYTEAGRRLEYVNAGHSPPVLLGGGRTRFLESTGLPLGLFPEVTPEARGEALEPGAMVVLYSDGITEARNSRGELYGVNRLVELLSRARDFDAGSLVESILSDVREFSSGAPIEDDQTVVVLKVNPA